LCGPAFLVAKPARPTAEGNPAGYEKRDVKVMFCAHFGRLDANGVDLSLSTDGDVVSGNRAENQTNYQPNILFAHAATFGESLKKSKPDKLRAGFYAGKKPG
jgi:hypothetical protein